MQLWHTLIFTCVFFQMEISELTAQNQIEQAHLDRTIQEEKLKQEMKSQCSATKIQAVYRGYR